MDQPIPNKPNRWRRFSEWDNRPLRLDNFAVDDPENGFSAMKGARDPKPGIKIENGRIVAMDGVAEAEAIDEIMKLGMNHPMGPLALADLIGLDVCMFILEVLHRDLGEDRYRPCPLLRKMVLAGRLGRKSKHGFYRYE